MRSHEHDVDGPSELRPAASRLDPASQVHVMRAAAEGRRDVIDPAGLLALQRASGNSAVARLVGEEDESPVHDVLRSGGGSPLPPAVREDMEGRLGHDFGDVHVHTDSKAHDSAVSVNAQAYTVGADVVFQDGKFDPSSTDGKMMLAHELTHVVQQRQGPVDGSPSPGGVNISHPSDRFEQEAGSTAERAMSAQTSGVTAAPGSIQRQEAEPPELEEPDVQASFIQRDEEPEEETEG